MIETPISKQEKTERGRICGNLPIPASSDEAYKYTWIVYILYFLSFPVSVISIAGVVIAYLKRDETAGTVCYGHMQYLIKTFWVVLAGKLIGICLIGSLFVISGLLVLCIVWIWFIYRVVAGFIKFNENQQVSVKSWF
ncbi:DUF4870 family protein [Neisseria canis]|uniref:DnaJ-family protein n=1 Tax=Neisseria canis TaxID=493 RepID=A0A3S4QVJ9_9NEIS|nr:hypothetical protein [Neisseria canis]VEF03394.1 dnaJ-family protein [Neisseria canis]